ncbi:MAG: SpoIIE family protein phosphatase [Flavobacteriales bacterium]|nr:SpoIIE family protein phosphatase [Flavobacteriales bacterium]MCB9198713.1 SpoIIE family protein phosphatase [Flavobacteriales bacterium]
MTPIKYFFVVFCFVLPFSVHSIEYLDSLKKVANGEIAVGDSKRVQAILELSKFSWTKNTDSAISLTNKALDLAEQLGDNRLMGDAWFDLGMIAYVNGSYESGLANFALASEAYEKSKLPFLTGNSLYQVGLCLKELGQYNEAILKMTEAKQFISDNENYQLAFSISNELGDLHFQVRDTLGAESNYLLAIKIASFHQDTVAVIMTNISLGQMYVEAFDLNQAIQTFNYAIKLTKPSNKQLLSQLYNHLGEAFLLKSKYEDALNNFTIALNLANESKSVVALAKSHLNLSRVYEIQEKYALALIEYKLYSTLQDTIESLSTKDISSLQAKFDNVAKDKEMKLKDIEMAKSEAENELKRRNESLKMNFMIGGLAVVCLFGVLLFFAFRRQRLANKKLDQLSMVAREIENTVMIADAEGNIEWINESYQRKYGLDLQGFVAKYGRNILDGVPNEEVKNKMLQSIREKKTVQFNLSNFDKNNQERHLKTTLTPKIDDEGEIEKMILIDTEVTEMVLAEKQIIKERDRYSSVYSQITESIDYAKRIQEAVLPHPSKIKKLFPNYYLQYLPKNGVSGDFYFIEETDSYIYLAGADCTGHGVPGALMSVICYNLLENAVHRFSETNDVLFELNRQLRRKLRQGTNVTDHIKDGLDIALVRIEKNKDCPELQYSGAHNPLYLIQSGNLSELKPSRLHLGNELDSAKSIETISLQINEPTEIIFFSDGFPDQKGGSQEKKFYYQPFRELLLSVSNLPNEEKVKHLNKVFNKWKLGKEQTDDVLVWGLKIKS